MTTEPAADGESAGDEPAADREGTADGAYTVTLDRGACEGIFACLVRDERFVEAADGLATIEDGAGGPDGDRPAVTDGGTVTARFQDDRLDAAQQAAAACPVDAIEVAVEGTALEGNDE